MEERTQVGQYTLVRKIGCGGMAEVWEAHHIHLANRVAVKFLLPEFAGNQELQQRFLNEGKRQAQLTHPNIVPATDFFQVDGRSYLVMQYVEGQNLEARLQKQNPALTLEEIHSISWDILSALDYAHSLGVIHRDVKPSNMLIDHNGRVLLMDFGIALALTEEQRVTRTETCMGTPDYMSPEQITRPKEVDSRSDIYSFGCVLYAMLSGDPPFTAAGVTPFYIQDRHVRMTPPPLVYRNPEIPPAVGEVVSQCLEKDPADRFQTCGEVMAALRAALSGESPERVEHRRSGAGKTRTYALVGTAAIILLSLLVYFLIPGKKAPPAPVKDWAHSRWDDPDFSNCKGDQTCLARKAQAGKLKEVKDWKQLPYNNALLSDCMDFQPCLDRKYHAEQLLATRDWSHADKQLLADCMGFPPCAQVKPKKTIVSGGDPGEYGCCRNAPNPAECRKRKAQDGTLGQDCQSIYGNDN